MSSVTEASQLESLRSHFHEIAGAVRLLGFIIIALSVQRFVRAPVLAARKGGQVATFEPGGGLPDTEFVAIDLERLKRGLPERTDKSERYGRGLTDFYRIQAGLAALAGLVLVIITLVA